MTPEIAAADLHPPRLPESFAALHASDMLAALGIGLLLATLIHLALRPAAKPARTDRDHDDNALISDDLSAPERLSRRAALFTRLGGRLPPDLRDSLYRSQSPEQLRRADERLDRLLGEARRRRRR
ncbi:hypothetical protein V8J36_02485 [Frigidibacter sp. MR17.14]|uniref:hypothetical protein n=1 Tax=Frigidibacter sp. MR17.14 TaxID=3126509 RepID=UPI0030131395